MLHISSFIDDVVFAHKLRLLDVATRLWQGGSHAALGLACRNTHCRYWTLGTSSWPVLKVTPQVATPGAECAVCDCLVWMAVHHFQPVTSSQYYHISSWLPISFQSSYLANLTESGHPTVIIHHSPLFYCWLQKTPASFPLDCLYRLALYRTFSDQSFLILFHFIVFPVLFPQCTVKPLIKTAKLKGANIDTIPTLIGISGENLLLAPIWTVNDWCTRVLAYNARDVAKTITQY